MVEDPRTQAKNWFPAMFTKFLMDVPRAGKPHEEQSGAARNKPLASNFVKVQIANLRQDVTGRLAFRVHEAGADSQVHQGSSCRLSGTPNHTRRLCTQLHASKHRPNVVRLSPRHDFCHSLFACEELEESEVLAACHRQVQPLHEKDLTRLSHQDAESPRRVR